ncbi:MAG: RHS repeat-associated core domain-containing protein [Ginsengibacter sp.]
MDNLTYTYKPNTNQLDKVTDAAPDVAAIEYNKYNDIKQGQQNKNYQYDEIGNLISDLSEKISNITWTVYGKINTITKTDGTNISYTYDASGNRISKTVSSKQTWYVRDATGDVMSIYSKDASINSGDLTQTEIHLYGSSRLGVFNLKNNVERPDLNTGRIITFTAGNKFFELSNHLGNVLATVSDKKIGVDTNGDGVIDYFTADVVSAQDYYPFGMVMPSRKYSVANTNYRYGFNGKELDREVSGTTTYDYGFRIYSPGLGRFLSVDPLIQKYPELTPYQFASNTPIQAVDLDGAESMFGWSIGLTPEQTAETANTWNKENAKIGYGTASGVKKSVVKTWGFITSDAWKAKTWKEFGSFLAEIPMSLSAVPIVATPRVDAVGDNFVNSVIKGDAFTRSEYFAELGTDVLLAKGLNEVFTVAKGMSLAKKISTRTNFVGAKYPSAIEKYGTEHINFTKTVSEVSSSGSTVNGKPLIQWREPGNPNPSPFFAFEGESPSTLGIPKTYTQKYSVQLSGEHTFLKTTANDVKAFSAKDPGINGMYKGGGTQLYSPDAAKSATFTPIKP